MLTALSRAIIAGALLAGSATAGDHFIISQCRQLSYTRVDPLRTPGAIGPHVHNVVGGSMFSADSTTSEILQQSKCSSTMVQDDKSIYWTPLLYYNHGNGSYSPMISSTRIYYFLKPGNGTVPVKAFPKGFRMLGGGYSDTRPQDYPPRGELSYDQKQALDPRINALMWGCSAGAVQGQGDGGSLSGQRPYLPNDAPNGCGVVNAGMFFPSCSDGRLDSDDHFSHMRYPLDGSNGYNCPPSHPIKYPTIFIEHFYFPSADQPYRGANVDNWVLANGDPTGLNMHGDFINGWNQDTLEQTMQQCNTPNAPEADLQACAPLAKSLNVDAANTCLSEGNIADEDVGLGAPITGFPGCNEYWGWESRTKPSCKTTSNVALVQPSGRYTVDEFKISLPVANGTTSKTVTGPALGNSTSGYDYDYYGSSSSYAATATSSYSDASTSSYPASTSTASASVTEAASALRLLPCLKLLLPSPPPPKLLLLTRPSLKTPPCLLFQPLLPPRLRPRSLLHPQAPLRPQCQPRLCHTITVSLPTPRTPQPLVFLLRQHRAVIPPRQPRRYLRPRQLRLMPRLKRSQALLRFPVRLLLLLPRPLVLRPSLAPQMLLPPLRMPTL
ncbi:hypothetical protein B0J17DRAFT_113152 [Rhizoctonia solani]|nr:hypothetical protein B0J17DRAFT_113152 [Rhizoctonia solani]